MMRLVLQLPDNWQVTAQAHQQVALSPGSTPEQPIAMVAWGPLVAATADDAWLWDKLLAVELGDRRLEIDAPRPGTTERGWRFTEVAARVFAGDELVETRLAVVYQLDEWRGTALARSFDRVRGDALEPLVRAVLARAVPDWRSEGEIVCIAHLYDDDFQGSP